MMKTTYKMVLEKMAMGTPQFSISQTSAMVLTTLHIGAEANKPVTIQMTTRVVAFFTKVLERVKMKYKERVM